jgi:hypothetical protein
MMHPIDFDAINAAALRIARSLLQELLPGGKFEGEECVALNPSRADKNLGSFSLTARKIGRRTTITSEWLGESACPKFSATASIWRNDLYGKL